MIKKYIKKLIREVNSENELVCGGGNIPTVNNDYIYRNMERLEQDINGLADFVGAQRVYGTAFTKLKKKK